jgi:GTPase
MFYDQVKINVTGGHGGKGGVYFRREKFIPFGGPSGGDGGKGGDVVFAVSGHLNTLYHFAHKKEFVAADGEPGRNKDRYGAGGADLVLEVPPGTLIFDAETGELLADLVDAEQQRHHRAGRTRWAGQYPLRFGDQPGPAHRRVWRSR